MNVGPPANFGRFRGPNGPAGGAFAPVEGRETAGDVAGGVAADGWRLWCGPHWNAVRRFPPPGKGGKVPVQPHPERGGKCQFSPTRKGGESAIFGAGGDQPPLATSRRCCLAAARLCVPPSDPAAEAGGLPGSIRPSGGCSDGGEGRIKYIIVPSPNCTPDRSCDRGRI